MKIAVVGAGSIGLLFAGRLLAVKQSVCILTHGLIQAKALNADGIAVVENETAIVFNGCAAPLDDWQRQWPEFAADWVFLTVKQKDIDESLVRKLSEILGSTGKLLCFQNGIGHMELLSDYLANERIYLAVTTEAAKKDSDRRVFHTGRGVTWIGPAERGALSDNNDCGLRELGELLAKAGFSTYTAEDMTTHVWQKLLINAVINPLTAVLGLKNGELLQLSYTRQLMRVMLAEGATIAREAGAQLPDDLWERLTIVCRETADNESSMLQDIKHGRRTEIDWINGSMIRLARERGMELLTHQSLYLLVKAREGEKDRDVSV